MDRVTLTWIFVTSLGADEVWLYWFWLYCIVEQGWIPDVWPCLFRFALLFVGIVSFCRLGCFLLPLDGYGLDSFLILRSVGSILIHWLRYEYCEFSWKGIRKCLWWFKNLLYLHATNKHMTNKSSVVKFVLGTVLDL